MLHKVRSKIISKSKHHLIEKDHSRLKCCQFSLDQRSSHYGGTFFYYYLLSGRRGDCALDILQGSNNFE